MDPNAPEGEEEALDIIFARYLHKGGKTKERDALLDGRPGFGKMPATKVVAYLDLALSCVQQQRARRPAMTEVLQALRAWTRCGPGHGDRLYCNMRALSVAAA